MQLQCLIVEDEPLAAEVLSDYIRQVPFLVFAGHCTDAVRALDFLKKKSVDVIFLDLHLPGIKGFDLLKTLPQRPQVIITTAYHQYALEGYEWNVADYLVKPVEFSRFLTAVNKLAVNNSSETKPVLSKDAPLRPNLFVYTDKKQVKIFPDEILYVESERDYLRIVLKTKTVIIRQTLQDFEKLLPSYFIRTHRSFIVNSQAIEAYDAVHIEAAGKSIPIGRQFKDDVLRKLQPGAEHV